MKKALAIVLSIVTIACLFIGCTVNKSNSTRADSHETTGESAVTEYGDGMIYYDRYAKSYNSLAELPFYDKDGKVYYYVDLVDDPSYFKDENGNKYPGDKCFVDEQSNFVYDDKGEITMGDDYVSAKGKDGKPYYPAGTVRWDIDGYLVTFFGFGETIK